MKISRYEESRKEALKALHRAICENNYYCKDEYLIVIENVTDNYNVDFTHTSEGDWADEVYEQDFDIAVDCAFSNKGSVYYVILGQSHQDCTVELLEKRRVYVPAN